MRWSMGSSLAALAPPERPFLRRAALLSYARVVSSPSAPSIMTSISSISIASQSIVEALDFREREVPVRPVRRVAWLRDLETLEV